MTPSLTVQNSCLAIRDDVEQVLRGGVPLVFDISPPIGEMEAYTANLGDRLRSEIGEHKLWIFGHLGDGNLHAIVQVKPQDYVVSSPKVEQLVYAPLAAFNGSISAQHGVGLEKKPYLKVSRNDNEIALMRALKAALDPKGILNRGKIF
jgi:FAD/FMN-containing dehydrogenase